MKSILMSIRPKWVEKIINGEKTIEVRKTAPKETPFKVYIYATKPKKYYKCGAVITSDELLWLANGKVEMGDGFKFWADGDEYQCLNGRVIGEFICDKIYELFPFAMGTGIELLDELVSPEMFCKESCLTEQEICDYIGDKDGYGWHISDLKIYNKPKELSEFFKPCSQSKNLDCDWLRSHNVCGCSVKQPITRPPQSYMFVEEVEQ